MATIEPAGNGNANAANAAADAKLTPTQKQALAKLDSAAEQFEGVFLNILMNAMQDTVPQQSIFGQDDSSEQTWQGMLNNERSDAMAKSGGFGLAKQLEQQMRGEVLGNADAEARADVDRRIEP
jgi:Rod binding domain-containing protein